MRKRLILLCVLGGIVAGWLAIVVLPRAYESEAKVFIRSGRESVTLDPTATTSATISMQKTQESEILSALEVLNSRQVAERVVDKLGAVAILDGQLPPNESDPTKSADQGIVVSLISKLTPLTEMASGLARNVLLSAGVKDNLSSQELAVRRIQSSVKIEAAAKSTVISIHSKSKTPEMAQAIVAAMTDVFLDEQLQVARTRGSLDFFQSQVAKVEQQLNRLQADRSDFMQEHEIVSLADSRDLMKDKLSIVNRDLMQASGELQKAKASVKDLLSKLDGEDDEIIAEKQVAMDETWSGMRLQAYSLELQEQNLAANLTDDNPKLISIRKQLDGARRILSQLESERIDENTTPNPLKVRLRESLQEQQTRVAALEFMIQELAKSRIDLGNDVDQMLIHEGRLVQMDRDIASLEANLLMLRRKEEEARVIDQLHTDKISSIHVFQPATFVERPASPNKKILGIGFPFLGLMAGLTLSFLGEGSSRTLRTVADVENKLGVPVVSTFPMLDGKPGGGIYRNACQQLMAEILTTHQRPGLRRGRTLGIISVDGGAGASTLAANLAVTSNLDGHRNIILVDADSRKRSLSNLFELNGSPGLVELLSGSASHDECLQSVSGASIGVIASAASNNQGVLTNGPAEIAQALEAYLGDCDLLIVDLPAANQPDQTLALAQCLDYVLVVVESEKTETLAADRLINRLSKGPAEIVGVVLTKKREYLPGFIQRFVGFPV
ncbi:GumC family protein [Neorhodopirellula pilleata]|nr:P-loop NTPase [Neorhodopirellula pilleata]